MTLDQAVETVRAHNQWRRGDGRCADMVDPQAVGIALDILVAEFDRERNLAAAQAGD